MKTVDAHTEFIVVNHLLGRNKLQMKMVRVATDGVNIIYDRPLCICFVERNATML